MFAQCVQPISIKVHEKSPNTSVNFIAQSACGLAIKIRAEVAKTPPTNSSRKELGQYLFKYTHSHKNTSVNFFTHSARAKTIALRQISQGSISQPSDGISWSEQRPAYSSGTPDQMDTRVGAGSPHPQKFSKIPKIIFNQKCFR